MKTEKKTNLIDTAHLYVFIHIPAFASGREREKGKTDEKNGKELHHCKGYGTQIATKENRSMVVNQQGTVR